VALHRLLTVGRRLVLAAFVVSVFFVATQEFQIFPGLLDSRLSGPLPTPPKGIDVLTTTSSDGAPVVVWRMKAPDDPKRVALIFHGNAERLSTFTRAQRWLASKGISTYAMEYRGYNGWNSGWPSEERLYADAEAAFELMRRTERIEPQDAVVLGSSIGTGIASHIAMKFHPKALVLLSPYTSLKDVVGELPYLGFLSPFLWYQFPSLENIATLRETCVVVAHGHRDTVIPFHHSTQLRDAYRGSGTFSLIESAEAGHNDILAHTSDRITAAISECFPS
jgi:fermentation-respiration switch protein FrsA (DUF1100 family)